ncbi:bifunctional phosphoribosyl-AMP cyclohydrolase/phosphoribosyl-ATP diphosphatase HisIE [Candidatus Acetothermia bacterium]|nr:bifunctional phosphoribosyl-AMP cyclohydrolase/phosphoribosyl-ATP diphosphatase HisIE [Candidatus Acetothermia bacterium]MBI3659698.1 bifunctional phosphoribosyl-AMP cyclohydrolase/phosphoribosyl-ATP diphosphatase HisIE [Candidatus Acetothermia bacterium]
MINVDLIKWNSDGLVPVIVQEVDGRVLMLAYANREALEKTIATGWMHYWSRSRQKLWRKGETSGHTQHLISLHLDCDQDVVLARVEQTGPACHTGAPTCFGDLAPDVVQELWRVFADRARTPKADSYVNLLLSDERRLRQKIGEEGVEVALAQSNEELVRESADLVFHLCVLLFARGLQWSEVLAELARRRR